MEQKFEPKVLQKLLIVGVVNTDYAQDCVIEAFDEGRQSVIDNIPNLEWKDENRFDDCENCTEESFSKTAIGDYSILFWGYSNEFTINYCGEQIKSNIDSLIGAKQAANEDYKNRIKKALGL